MKLRRFCIAVPTVQATPTSSRLSRLCAAVPPAPFAAGGLAFSPDEVPLLFPHEVPLL